MDRFPEHFKQDPNLNERLCNQPSLDEFTERLISDLEEEVSPVLVSAREKLKALDPEEQELELFRIWRRSLLPGTTLNDMYYLMGVTDVGARNARVDQVNATFLEAAAERGIVEKRGDPR